MRTYTPPPSTISRTSTPAYHSSPGDSESLDESWYPVASPTTSNTNSNSNSDPEHYLSDNDTLSSSIYSVGSDTAASLTSTESESDNNYAVPMVVGDVHENESMLEGGYIDADASTLGGSTSTLSNTVPLIYPVYNDLENSFNSSTTTTASDGTTPSASVGELHNLPKAQRLSSYRLEKMVQSDKGGLIGSAKMGWGNQALFGGGIHDVQNPVPANDEMAIHAGDPAAITAQETREGVKTDRLRRALATVNMAHIRGASQKWSLKVSIFTLASLLGLVLATVRYSGPASEPVTGVQPPVGQVKPFSILDYLSPSSLSTSLFDPAPSSIMPDVRLIKNALSLSTKAAALVPAEVKSQAKTTPKSKEKDGETVAVNTLALRGDEAGLTAFLHGTGSTWQKARDMVMPSAPPVIVPSPVLTGAPVEGFGQIILGDIKSAWTRALSSYSHADFIHYLRIQILATIQLEIQQAILLAKYLVAISKNVSRTASPHIRKGADSILRMYDNARQYTQTINITASTDLAASRAKMGYENVSMKAAMTSQKGREAIKQARAGLEYLVAEARRKAGINTDSIKAKPQPQSLVQRGKLRTFKERIKTHRGKLVPGLYMGGIHWPGHGPVQVPVPVPKETKMSTKQKFMQALHNAAMPLVV